MFIWCNDIEFFIIYRLISIAVLKFIIYLSKTWWNLFSLRFGKSFFGVIFAVLKQSNIFYKMKKIILFSAFFFSTFLFSQSEYGSISQLPDYEILKRKWSLKMLLPKQIPHLNFPEGWKISKGSLQKNGYYQCKIQKYWHKSVFHCWKNGYVRFVTATGSDKNIRMRQNWPWEDYL